MRVVALFYEELINCQTYVGTLISIASSIPQGRIDTYLGHADSSHRTRGILYDAEVIVDTLQSNGKTLLDLYVPSSLKKDKKDIVKYISYI